MAGLSEWFGHEQSYRSRTSDDQVKNDVWSYTK